MKTYIKTILILTFLVPTSFIYAQDAIDTQFAAVKKANDNQEQEKEKLNVLLKQEEDRLKGIRSDADLESGGFDYRVFTPSIRTFFDTGTDDEGEIDLYEDGKLGLSLNFISLDYMWAFEKSIVGPTVSLGLSTASGEATNDSTVFFWGIGMRTTLKGSTKVPISFELGYMQGISPDESLDATQRDDGAIYVSIDIPLITDTE